MSLPPGVTTYRTMSMSSDTLSNVSPTVQYVTNEIPSCSPSYRTVSVPVSPTQMSHVQYAVNGGAVDGNVVYGTMRYLVPVERRVMPESYMVVNRAPQIMASPNLSPMYIQNYSMGSQDGLQVQAEHSLTQSVNGNGQASSVMSQTSSPPKSPEPTPQVEVEVECANVQQVKEVQETVTKVSRVSVRSPVPQIEPQAKLDTRFFGELLADIHRKNCDIYTCISEHVSKIRGRKQSFDTTDYKVGKEEVEALIPKGVSELTKQQIRYLLQTRMTADNTMRLLLSTFSSLREELIHLQEDLKRLESEKEELERDLSFKADQAQQYDHLLEAVRENNRQLQVSLKESSSAQRKMETQLLSARTSESSHDFRVKELDGRLKALEKENEMLRQKLAGQSSTMTLQTKTEELSRQYNQMLSALREEKDKELQMLKTQLLKTQTESSSQSSGEQSLQLRITELISTLEQRQIIIKRQEEVQQASRRSHDPSLQMPFCQFTVYLSWSSLFCGSPVVVIHLCGLPVLVSPLYGLPILVILLYGLPVLVIHFCGSPVLVVLLYGLPVLDIPHYGLPVLLIQLCGLPVFSTDLITSISLYRSDNLCLSLQI